MEDALYIGTTKLKLNTEEIKGEYITIEGERYYRIRNYDLMPPFFMSIVSSSDHWLFISSGGALTAGRKNPENALFPYCTDDKIHDSNEITGSKTIFQIERNDQKHLWEPFSNHYQGIYKIRRTLYKNVFGNKIIFEESNEDLGIQFRYGWFNSDKYGFVRKSWIVNTGTQAAGVHFIDGIQNILPFGVNKGMQTELSTLVDAYKKNELHAETGLGLFLLSSIIVDRAEPSEALKATTVWSLGLEKYQVLLSSRQLQHFREGKEVFGETEIRAERGAYFLFARMSMVPGSEKTWCMAANLKQGPSEVASLIQELKGKDELLLKLNEDIYRGTRQLESLVSSADGLQLTNSESVAARHFANVLFNIMRGGVFVNNYRVQKADLLNFLESFNPVMKDKYREFLNSMPQSISHSNLMNKAAKVGDDNFFRLCCEYLPLTFSRRHGDPSRPWNKFDIDVKATDGSSKLSFQGNWRDIFQNWEALGYSFPGFTKSMICKFVNASTADGYNPYRITREGIDWEITDPEDPWSFIGYWGDHQIIYLLKLLESAQRHQPGMLRELLSHPIFAYANVPYKIKSYTEQLLNPFDTVVFDFELQATIEERVKTTGADGKLIWNEKEEVYLVNLTEKLLVSLLAKLANYIHEGGIWLNTQRPEWNDANNALVGNGVSMVTLYYMRRFVVFCERLFQSSELEFIDLSEEVNTLLKALDETFHKTQYLIGQACSGGSRKILLDQLGGAHSAYRQKFYTDGFSGSKQQVAVKGLIQFFGLIKQFIDHSIKANRREDGLYHAYNLMSIKDGLDIQVSHLYEMLEGQVAVLSSGLLSPGESLEVLKTLRNSSMFRPDQYSYILYPDRQLPLFLEKNNIPEKFAEKSILIARLIEDENRLLVEKDVTGKYHFNSNIRNANDLKSLLMALKATEYKELAEQEEESLLQVFEKMFDHKSFTGRSGTFFGYEGLGSIYWHMVSKLLLAAGEVCYDAIEKGENPETVGQLIHCYYDIRAGIGFNKNPKKYGAFPTDPYSHTPSNAGAQQPGMTGQVKEDILSRFLELGVVVNQGKISFRPWLLKEDEFLKEEAGFMYCDLQGQCSKMLIPASCLAFTYCQAPVVYQLSSESEITLTFSSGEQTTLPGLVIDAINSALLFDRVGTITRVDVKLRPGAGTLIQD